MAVQEQAKVVSMVDTPREKVFFNHTSKYEVVKLGYTPSASVALRLSDDGTSFIYGVTICSYRDNFSKKTGREISESRMKQGFGTIPVPEALKNLSNREKCLTMVYTITESVICKTRKWKKRVSSFNKDPKAYIEKGRNRA